MSNIKHNRSHHPLYVVWTNMIRRCYNPAADYYMDYGGRGIKVWSIWHRNFTVFYYWAMSRGYEHGLQIDRRDNDKGYYPDNCRFVTPSKNCVNRRSKRGVSGYLGVSQNGAGWNASVKRGQVRKAIGTYDTVEQAAKARAEYIKKEGL